MASRSRTKGHSFEREIANDLKEIFPEARRKLEYSLADCTGVDLQDTGEFKIQCKRLKGSVPMSKIKEIKEAGIHLLVAKSDRDKTMAVLYWEDLLNILGELHAYRAGSKTPEL
jgi:hypothetical protein